MSNISGKSSGGVNPNQKKNSHATSSLNSQSIGYRTKLRPRPTKQTIPFESPSSSKRKKFTPHSNATSVDKKLEKTRFPSKENSKPKKTVEANKVKPQKRKLSNSAKAQSEPTKVKKLASSSSCSDELSKSDTSASTSKGRSENKGCIESSKRPQSAKVKSTSRPKPPHKSKSDTGNLKSESFSGVKKGKIRKWQEKYLSKNSNSASSSNSNNTKTGSCVSSRRGSERGKSSSGGARSRSSSLRAPEEPCSDESATTSNRQSRNKTGKQNEGQGTSNDTASTSRSTSRTNESESSTMSNNGAAANSNGNEEDNDLTRIQALLEARGLPPHFFGSLGPRMQQILHRSMGAGTNSKAQQYLQSIQDTTDESRQLQGAINMCQLLVMGNEDTLIGFPVKSSVPALIALLRKEHNFDLMNHACRALTYMMEALPRSSYVVVDAIPVFLEKLQSIQCMDVAEQSLTALETLSRRHSQAIIQAGGFAACLLYIDFFSLPAQRSAINIAANCSLALGSISSEPDGSLKEYENLVKSSIPILSNRLLQHDKKCVESSAQCIVHLIDAYHHDHRILESIAETDVMENLRQLLVITRSMLSSNTFVNVLRVITILCSCLVKVASDLIDNNIAETIKYLLCGAVEDNSTTELTPRLPQELYELTSLICKLLPKLPEDNELFVINSSLWQSENGKAWNTYDRLSNLDQAVWQWRDENGQWRSYFRHDSRLIEAAYLGNEGDVSVSIMENSYTIDFDSMQQINEDSGTSRAVQRTLVNTVNKTKQKSLKNSSDVESTSQSKTSLTSAKVEYNKKSLSEFIKTLFTVLYEVYNSSAGSPSVRHRCLQSLLSMVYYSEEDVLKEMLETLSVSSHISSMLSSPDICIAVGALQMAEMLMEKLPDIFRNYFLREGVVHQVKKIADGEHHGMDKAEASSSSPPIKDRQKRKSSEKLKSTQKPPPLSVRAKTTSSLMKGNKNSAKDKSPEAKKSPNSSHNTRSSSFLGSFNPSKWGKSLLTFNSSGASSDSNRSSPSSFHFSENSSERSSGRHSSKSSHANKQHLLINNENKEAIKKWLNTQAVKFITTYFNEPSEDGKHKSIDSEVLSQLLKISEDLNRGNEDKTKSLENFRSIITSMDVSSFELQYSGIVKSLLQYLTMNPEEETHNESSTVPDVAPKTTVNNNIESPASSSKILNENSTCNINKFEDCESHARTFLRVFAGIPESTLENQVHIKNTLFLSDKIDPFYDIVKKLNACVSQLEHLPVKTQDVMSSSAQTLHFFSTRQLKCQLHRHPNCTNVKQWHGGPVRIDPLVQVNAIERYLVARGYGVKTSAHKYKNLLPEGYLSCEDDEDNESDESGSNHELLSVNDIVNTVADSATSNSTSSATSSSAASSHWMESAQSSKSSTSCYRLNFYIGNQKLSHDMSVFQAIKQYSTTANADENNMLANDLTGSSAIWSKTHVITYELAEPDKPTGKSKNMTNRAAMKKSRQRNSYTKSSKVIDTIWSEGKVPDMLSPLRADLVYNLPDSFLSQDPSKDVLCLLRVLNSIARHWYYLYPKYCVYTDKSIVSQSEFINTKIDTKCKRQLQDPLMIMTGQLPQWLRDLANFCPFLLSFDTRMVFFHVTGFDRDHAMQYLLDSGGRLEFNSSMGATSNSSDTSRNGASHHLNPRLEKKKCSVSRSELLTQAEKIMNDYAHSKAVLEIDYKGEVGTGLGPTLEFFTLASKEMQRDNLKLWRNEKKDDDIKKKSPENKEIITTDENDYVVALFGLFPHPIGKNTRGTGFAKKRSKFKFLGKLLGKALSDGRMLDITFSEVFYKWLLNMEESLTDTNLQNVDAGIYQTFIKLKEVASTCAKCQHENDIEGLKEVDMDGCPVEDLGLYMVLPGDESFELIKGGKNIAVTSENLVQYLDLISYWCLVEGVRKQFEALREGFESVINPKSLSCFYPEELDQVFCGSKYKQWTMQELSDACVTNHGYTQDNPTVLMLYRILSSYEVKEQRDFLQFVTGSPHLPVGGLKAMNPPLTIVRKTCEDKSLDASLPSVMTCVNYLKLPEYSSEEIMRDKLRVAAAEGQNSFLLS